MRQEDVQAVGLGAFHDRGPMLGQGCKTVFQALAGCFGVSLVVVGDLAWGLLACQKPRPCHDAGW